MRANRKMIYLSAAFLTPLIWTSCATNQTRPANTMVTPTAASRGGLSEGMKADGCAPGFACQNEVCVPDNTFINSVANNFSACRPGISLSNQDNSLSVTNKNRKPGKTRTTRQSIQSRPGKANSDSIRPRHREEGTKVLKSSAGGSTKASGRGKPIRSLQ